MPQTVKFLVWFLLFNLDAIHIRLLGLIYTPLAFQRRFALTLPNVPVPTVAATNARASAADGKKFKLMIVASFSVYTSTSYFLKRTHPQFPQGHRIEDFINMAPLTCLKSTACSVTQCWVEARWPCEGSWCCIDTLPSLSHKPSQIEAINPA